MSAKGMLKDVGDQECRDALIALLDAYLNPAFSALPKSEIDLAFMDAMESLGYISKSPSEYELIQKLRVTRAKARNLYYNRELRKRSPEQLDTLVREVIQAPLIHKDGDLFVLEIDSPLVIDHLRSKVRSLGFPSDGSFSPSLVKLSLRAFTALLEESIPKVNRNQVKNKLVAAGAPDGSLGGVLKGALKQVGKKVAQDAGEAVSEKASDYITPIIDGSISKIGSMFKGLFSEDIEAS